MSELEQLRQEAEQLRNQIRVSPNTDTAKNKPHWGPDHHVRVYVAIMTVGFSLSLAYSNEQNLCL